MTWIYPAYIFVFQQLTGAAQAAFACLLPTLKLLSKNAINFLLLDEEDDKPEFIIFSVEIFHALYVACCMQHSTSHHTTIVLTVIDFLFAIKSVLNIRSSLQEAEQIILSHPVDRSSRGSTHSRHSITALEHKSLKLEHVKLALCLLETSTTLAQHDAIRVWSQIPLERLQNRIYPQATFQLRDQVHVRQENKSSNSASTPPENDVLTDEAKRAVQVLSDAHRLLQILYWTEFVLLVEYTEVIVPIVYCAYLWTAFYLPNRAYYSQLRDIDEVTLLTHIRTVLVYVALQALSLVLMVILLHLKLRISTIRQLTFVLESQWQQVQTKLILWVSFSVQPPVEHFGENFSFQLAWLRKPRVTD